MASIAERSPIVTTVASAAAARLPAPVEATAYQVASHVLVAITDAGASSASISAQYTAGSLTVEVTDNATCPTGWVWETRLDGLDDRVAALHGRIEVETPADRGTVVRTVIPCESY